MAKNRVYESGKQLSVPVASGVVSGDPVVIGSMTGVALIDRDSAGNATVDFWGVYTLSVKGADDAGNAAVAVGDPIYYVDADTPKLSKKSSGAFFGFALETVGSGSTATIMVKTVDALGPGRADQAVGAISFSNARAFVSAEQTGTGSAQNVAHGLGAAPAAVLVAVTELPDAAAETGFDVAEGTHTTTNVVVTVTNTVKFKVFAWA